VDIKVGDQRVIRKEGKKDIFCFISLGKAAMVVQAIDIFAISHPGRLRSHNLLPCKYFFFSCQAGKVSA